MRDLSGPAACRTWAEIRLTAMRMREKADRYASSGDNASLSRTTSLVSIAQALEWASGQNNAFGQMIARLEAIEAAGDVVKGRAS